MHPEIGRELTAQRNQEMRARAEQASLARAVGRMRRALRHGTDPSSQPHRADEFVVPPIPDYVDGSFRTTPAGQNTASEPDREPASRRAA
jgi:hypothetical protein